MAYRDMITYQLADGVSKQQLLQTAGEVYDQWMRHQPGFIKWEIQHQHDDVYCDIVYWESDADAKAAEQDMVNVANAADWFACYKEGSISSKSVTIVKTFSNP